MPKSSSCDSVSLEKEDLVNASRDQISLNNMAESSNRPTTEGWSST